MSNNRTIFLNTIFLYLRMLLVLSISLYTTRIVFNVLGVDDFGLYSLVASFVVLFSFMNSAMRSGIQRYINVAIPKGKKETNKVFVSSMFCQILVLIIFLFFSETLGVWFINYKLNIANESIYAANVVFQFSIFSVLLNIISVPYQSLILAKEKMGVYTYIGVFEAISKLFVVYILIFFKNFNSLIVYAGLIFIISFFVNFLYFLYAKKKFINECKIKEINFSSQTKEIISFSSWNLLGQFSSISSRQGIVVIFNIFYGVKINASIAIANQINALIFNFISNLQTAFNPQIVQTFVKSEISRHRMLVLNSSRYSLYLIVLISIPFLTSTDFLLNFWLGNKTPNLTASFVIIIIISSMFEAVSGPLWMSAHAIGNIKRYQLVISSILISALPISYLLIYLNFTANISFISIAFISFLAYIYRFFYFYKNFSFTVLEIVKYIKDIVIVFSFVFIVIFIKDYIFYDFNFIYFIKYNMLIEVIFLILLFVFCISSDEKIYFKKFILKIFPRLKFFHF